MSSITNRTQLVWTVTVYRENKIILEDDIEFFDFDTAVDRAKLYVSQYVEETGLYHHAELKPKVVPIYN